MKLKTAVAYKIYFVCVGWDFNNGKLLVYFLDSSDNVLDSDW